MRLKLGIGLLCGLALESFLVNNTAFANEVEVVSNSNSLELPSSVTLAESKGFDTKELGVVEVDTESELENHYLEQNQEIEAQIQSYEDSYAKYQEELARYTQEKSNQEEVYNREKRIYDSLVAENQAIEARNEAKKLDYENTLKANNEALSGVYEEHDFANNSMIQDFVNRGIEVENEAYNAYRDKYKTFDSLPVSSSFVNPVNNKQTVVVRNQKDFEFLLGIMPDGTKHNRLENRWYVNFENEEDLVVPKGVYQVRGWVDWFMTDKAKGSIDFNDSIFVVDSNAGFITRFVGDYKRADGSRKEFKNLKLIGSVDVGLEFGDDIARIKKGAHGLMFMSGLNVSNVDFKNLDIYAAHGMSTHVFDLLGSYDIRFDDVKFYGYATPSYDENLIRLISKDSDHRVYAETIQFDAAYGGGLGDAELKHPWHSQLYTKDMLTGEGSHDIVVNRSLSTNYDGPVGKDLIRGIYRDVLYRYGSTMGAHGFDRNIPPKFRNITIQNSVFDNLTYNPFSRDKRVHYPIHLITTGSEEYLGSIKAVNNRFTNIRGDYYEGNGETRGAYKAWYKDVELKEPVYEFLLNVVAPKRIEFGNEPLVPKKPIIGYYRFVLKSEDSKKEESKPDSKLEMRPEESKQDSKVEFEPEKPKGNSKLESKRETKPKESKEEIKQTSRQVLKLEHQQDSKALELKQDVEQVSKGEELLPLLNSNERALQTLGLVTLLSVAVKKKKKS